MSRVITIEKALECYTEAVLSWGKGFAFPVFKRSAFQGKHSTAYSILSGATVNGTGNWLSQHGKPDIGTVGFPLLIESLLRNDDEGGPEVLVTFPENIFVWKGPFKTNLFHEFHRLLLDRSLGQTKGRATGRWKENGSKRTNAMRIRVPHK